MKVLLLNITVGDGLKKICNAVASKLDEENIENKTIDVYADDKKATKRSKDTYYKLVKFIPNFIRKVQHSLCYYNKRKICKSTTLLKADLKALEEKLPKFVQGYDVVFTPVGFIAVSLQQLKREEKIDRNIKIIFCVPDFNIPICSETLTDIDAIVTPCQEVYDFYSKAGIKNLYNLGVPVDKKFLIKEDREEICKEINIENRETILYMCGGFGFGKTHKVIKTLHKYSDAQIIVVNGKNEVEKVKIDNWIKDKNIKGVINFGYCNNVDKLMSVSDVLISKPGMATMVEAAAKGLVIANIRQILYPEYDNMLHLEKYNGGIFCKNYKTLFNELNKKNYKNKAENFQKIFNKNASNDIVNLIKGIV